MLSAQSDNCIPICKYFWHHIFICCLIGRAQNWYMRQRVNNLLTELQSSVGKQAAKNPPKHYRLYTSSCSHRVSVWVHHYGPQWNVSVHSSQKLSHESAVELPCDAVNSHLAARENSLLFRFLCAFCFVFKSDFSQGSSLTRVSIQQPSVRMFSSILKKFPYLISMQFLMVQ